MAYLRAQNIDGYIPDNQFRQRDARYKDLKTSHPAASRANPEVIATFTAADFKYDREEQAAQCPAGERLNRYGIFTNANGRYRRFEGRSVSTAVAHSNSNT